MSRATNGRRDEADRRWVEVVQAVLPSAVTVEVPNGPSADLVVNGTPLEIKWVGEGWLRQVKPFLGSGRRRPDVVVARRMSPGAQEALSTAGIGWVDETGAAEIVIGPIVVSRTGRPEPPRQKQPKWTPATLAVAEALLCNTKATVSAVEETTGLSAGACTTALRFLSDLGLLSAEARRGRESGRSVADVDELLDAYASAAASVPPKARLEVGITWRDVLDGLRETGRKWDQAAIDWATTGTAASRATAPFLTSTGSAVVYVDASTSAGLQAVAEAARLRPIDGGRLTLMPFPTVATRLLSEKVDGVHVAPWPRVYADLRVTGVRGEEAAEHLREVVRGR
jgi:hypothetical protein